MPGLAAMLAREGSPNLRALGSVWGVGFRDLGIEGVGFRDQGGGGVAGH